MDRLNREIDIDPEKNTAEIECGMTIAELNDLCAQKKTTLISPTLYPLPQVGGAISTGSHGTGFGVKTFADSIVEMTFVKHDGSLATVKEGDPDYDAAKVALGTFGIIYSVKLKTTADFPVFTDKVLVPVEAVLEGFDDLVTSCQYLEMFWFPFQKQFWVYLMDPSESLPDKKTWLGKQRKKLNTKIQDVGGGLLTPWVARRAPRLTPYLNKMAIRLSDSVGATVEWASEAFHFQEAYPKNFDLSYAVPIQYSRCAWKEAIRLVEEFGNQGLYPVNLALHCRFLGASSTWLATDYGRETCVIEVATAKGTPQWEDFYRRMEECWFAIPKARPHWGKVYTTARQLKSRYERMDDFLRKRQVWDPDRVFLNDFLEDQVFQLNEAAPVEATPYTESAPPPVAMVS
jgi:FAD/FMN-containing dehydrogenase